MARDEHSTWTAPSERPTTQDLDRLLEKTRLRIEDLLWRHGCAVETSTGLIREAVMALAHRWNRVHNREQWFLDRIEKAVRRTANPFLMEPRDDEEPS